MSTLKFALCLACLCSWRSDVTADLNFRQDRGFISATVGQNLTLRCFYEDDLSSMFLWYKQSLGQKLRLVSSFYKHDQKGTFNDEFKDNPRFSLETKKGENHLKISDLHVSDSATYYCVRCYSYKFDFAEGVTVNVRGSGVNVPALVHQSASESVHPVTLNCTVHTGTCDGEHSVYWFKHSGESHPGLIYTQGGRAGQCERKDGTHTHTCVYNLPVESLNGSHAETLYCAVASCGHILFGDKENMDSVDKGNSPNSLVYYLSGALTISTFLVAFLIISLYKITRRSHQCLAESQSVSTSNTTHAEGNDDADNLHYAALRNYKVNKSRKQRDDTRSECVYSGVRQ